MNFTNKGPGDRKDPKFDSLKKTTTLNPHAAAFVPSSLKVTYGSTNYSVATRLDIPGSSKSAALDQTVANTSNTSDDDIHQHWRHQLPENIVPTFGIIGDEVINEPENISLASLSLHENFETVKLASSVQSQTCGRRLDMQAVIDGNFSYNENKGYSGLAFSEPQSTAAFMPSATNSWCKSSVSGEPHYANGREGNLYNGDHIVDMVDALFSDNAVLENALMNPIEVLSSQFPGFAAQSIADVYYENGCDLNLTIEILTQLELHLDGNFDQNHNAKPLVPPTASLLDFAAFSATDSSTELSKYDGENVQFLSSTQRSLPSMLKGENDFTSTVRKLASHDSGWTYNIDSPTFGAGVGSSRSSEILTGYYSDRDKMTNVDKLQGSGGVRAASIWLETGEEIGNLNSELKEETHEFALRRNAYFEKARQAFLIGNKSLAKDLSMKGQLYNMKLRAAQEKAKEIGRQRFLLSSEIHEYSRGQDPLIDLRGLHVTEAIHVLNQKLGKLRRATKYMGQHLQVMICVGTYHHMKGLRTPTRLQVTVEQYLQDEGFDFKQPQPGLLRVVI